MRPWRCRVGSLPNHRRGVRLAKHKPACRRPHQTHNTARLHSYLGDIPPAEFEAAFYDDPRTDQPLIGIQ
jgi:hypothetical protein